MVFKEEKEIDRDQLIELYEDAGWKAYTNNPDRLVGAVRNSLFVLTAWDGNKLVGLIRLVGDGLTIAFIQDILVRKDNRRGKVGTSLLVKALERFKDVRQKVLLTEDSVETRGFYESLGFESCDKGQLVAFTKPGN